MISNILITGGCGFIGSHLVRHFTNKYRKYNIINLDFLTYAANFNNLQDLKQNNYQFIKGDICNRKLVMEIFEKYKIPNDTNVIKATVPLLVAIIDSNKDA